MEVSLNHGVGGSGLKGTGREDKRKSVLGTGEELAFPEDLLS